MLELDEYKKIMADPQAEIDSLWKRLISWQQDSQYIVDHTLYHFVNMVSGMLHKMGQEYRLSVHNVQFANEKPDLIGPETKALWESREDFHRVAVTQLLAVVREEMDALDAKKEKIRASGEIVLKDAAEQIRRELVCCNVYQRIEDGYNSSFPDDHELGVIAEREIKRSPDYHAICHFGEWSARIVENLA